MKYYIGTVVLGSVGQRYREIIDDLSSNFGLKGLTQHMRIPHITLKAPFETSDISPVEHALHDYSQTVRKFPLRVQGFGAFGEDVIYMALEHSEELRKTHTKLLSILQTIEGVEFSEFDKPDKILHVTIAKGDELKGKFKHVWPYLQSRECQADSIFDDITIFRKGDKGTEIHLQYPLR